MQTTHLIYPSKRKHRIAVSTLFFLQGISFATWASRIPSIQQKLQLTETALGAILFALPAGSMFSLPLSGWLVAKVGSRKVTIIGMLFYGLFLISLGFAYTKLSLVVVLVFYGLVGNMCNIALNTQAVGIEALYGRPVMASFHGMWSLAGFTAAFIGSIMIGNNIPPYQHFILICALMVTFLLLSYKHTLKEDINSGTGQKIFVKPDRSLVNLGIISFCCMLCEGAMFDWSGIYFKNVVKTPEAWIGAGYTAFMFTMASGRFIADWFANKFGTKRTLQISGVLTSTGLLTAILFPGLVTAIIGFLMVGFGVSSVIPLVYSIAGKSKKMSAGVAIAAVSSIGFLGFLLGPPMIGIVAGIFSLRISFSIIAFIGMLIFVMATKLRIE